MRLYLTDNVWDSALKRINRIFDEFDNVMVSYSGGKDSCVIFNLALKVARERNRLPLTVMFIDQEAEWQATIDNVKTIMESDEVNPLWLQVPIQISNGTSADKDWLQVWGDGEEWMREKDPISIKENVYGTNKFYDIFTKAIGYHFKGKPVANLGGVRTEESPTRFAALTTALTYRDITWGKKLNEKENQYTFYPIYDWTYTDVWKAIFDNEWIYNKVYDYQYQYGVPIHSMRVSSLHHETAVGWLFIAQEIEKETWNRLSKRLSGVSTAGRMGKTNFFVKELPYMFKDWREYRDYLTLKITSDKHRPIFEKKFDAMDATYKSLNPDHIKELHKVHVASLITGDYHFTKVGNWENKFDVVTWRKWKAGKNPRHAKINKYILNDLNYED